MEFLFNTLSGVNSLPVNYNVYKISLERYYIEVLKTGKEHHKSADFVIYFVDNNWITYNPRFIDQALEIGKQIGRFYKEDGSKNTG